MTSAVLPRPGPMLPSLAGTKNPFLPVSIEFGRLGFEWRASTGRDELGIGNKIDAHVPKL